MTDYGRCLSCTDSLRSGRYVSGVRVVAEAIYRRLITRPGELLDDPDYGFCIGDYLGASVSDAEVAMLPGLVRQQILRDARVSSAVVDVAETGTSADRSWTITVSAYTDAGPFELVLAVSDVTTAILGITA